MFAKLRFNTFAVSSIMHSSRYLLLFWGLLWLPRLYGQDLHFSQFYLNPIHSSPASAGVFEGTWRVGGIYRSQWYSVPVSYRTYAFAADGKLLPLGKSIFSLGLLLQQDQAGDGRLSWGQGGINLAASHQIGSRQNLSLGFGVAGIQREVDLSGLRFKNQWDGEAFDPNLPSKELQWRQSGIAPTLSAGLAWQYRAEDSRSSATLGAGLFHLNGPVVSLGENATAKLPVRLAVYGEGIFQSSERTDWVGIAALQRMGKAQELLFGGGVRQMLTQGMANNTFLRATLSTRWKDAIIPALQLERNNWIFGLSYDWNISRFDEATNGRGGVEIGLIWRWITVKVPPKEDCCPVF